LVPVSLSKRLWVRPRLPLLSPSLLMNFCGGRGSTPTPLSKTAWNFLSDTRKDLRPAVQTAHKTMLLPIKPASVGPVRNMGAWFNGSAKFIGGFYVEKILFGGLRPGRGPGGRGEGPVYVEAFPAKPGR